MEYEAMPVMEKAAMYNAWTSLAYLSKCLGIKLVTILTVATSKCCHHAHELLHNVIYMRILHGGQLNHEPYRG